MTIINYNNNYLYDMAVSILFVVMNTEPARPMKPVASLGIYRDIYRQPSNHRKP